jgi:hypothetical protein
LPGNNQINISNGRRIDNTARAGGRDNERNEVVSCKGRVRRNPAVKKIP